MFPSANGAQTGSRLSERGEEELSHLGRAPGTPGHSVLVAPGPPAAPFCSGRRLVAAEAWLRWRPGLLASRILCRPLGHRHDLWRAITQAVIYARIYFNWQPIRNARALAVDARYVYDPWCPQLAPR